MRDLPGPGIKSPALAGRFISTAQPGKSTILSIFNCTVQQCYIYSHCCITTTPLAISRTFSFSQTETLYTVNKDTSFPFPPAPGNHHSTLFLYEFNYTHFYMSGIIQYLPFCYRLLISCLQGSSMLLHVSELPYFLKAE